MRTRIIQSTGYDMLGATPKYALFPYFESLNIPPSLDDNAFAQFPEDTAYVPFDTFTITPQATAGAEFTWTLEVSNDNINFFEYGGASKNRLWNEAFEMIASQNFKFLTFRIKFMPLKLDGGVSFLVTGYKNGSI